jgi:iron complex transport system substrate-binding protein
LLLAIWSQEIRKRMAGQNKDGSGTRRPARLAVIALVALAGLATALWPHSRTAMPEPGSAGLIRVTDETGRAVAVPQPVRRIVSLAPNLTETLFALGVGERVVGVTDYCDYPPEAAAREHVGGPVTPNLEKIAQLRPDLVVATRAGGNRLATVHSLETLGIAVFATDPHSVDEVIISTERLGELAGASEQGRLMASGLRARLNAVSERLSGSELTRVLLVVWPEPLITVGRNTFMADALRRAGAENVIQTAQDWPNASLEEVARRRPEYLIFASDHSEQTNRQIAELGGLPGWRSLEAMRNKRVIVLGEAIARPAPRLVDVIETLARTLHPERFSLEMTGAPAIALPPALPLSPEGAR